jgi:threonine dehydrogenase-like Zn-dependent dehydrogenase
VNAFRVLMAAAGVRSHRLRRHRRPSNATVWIAGAGSVAALFLACCGCLAGARVIEGLMR